MLARLIKYGGLSGKIRAMYGNRLKSRDYQKLSAMKTVPEIAIYLKNHPGWSESLNDLTSADMHRANIEEKLRGHLLNEYQRIFKFMSRDDHPIMIYPILRAEMDQILLFLRLLKAGRPHDYVFSVPEFYNNHSKINFDAFRNCTSYSMFLENLRGSLYYAPLVALTTPDGSIPEYPIIDTTLKSRYFNSLLSGVDKYYKGEIKKLLKTSFGMQTDILNIIHVVRLRRYFKVPADQLFNYMIPVYLKLRPSYLETLYFAKDDEAEIELLKSGPYGKLFSDQEFSHIEDYYYKKLYDFNHAYIHSGIPSVYTAIAYLTLREIELKDLINIIECVRYGLPVEKAPSVLVGL